MIHYIETAADPHAKDFLAYCAAHGNEHDESYVPGVEWRFGGDYPSFVVLGTDGSVRGVAAAMTGGSYKAARRARVAIVHVAGDAVPDDYRSLFSALAGKIAVAADELYLFIPEALAELRAILDGMGFSFERTAYLMRATTGDTAPAVLPAGYTLEPVSARDAGSVAEFINTRNRNFREVRGSSDARVEDLAAFIASDEYLDGGLVRLLAPDGGTCGTLRVERDLDDGSAFIGTISVDREHRGKGLARALIRSALSIARDAGIQTAFLSVNADNLVALELYRKEGFSLVKAMTCLTARIVDLRRL